MHSIQPEVDLYHCFTEHFVFYLWSDLLMLPAVYLHINMALKPQYLNLISIVTVRFVYIEKEH